MRLSRRRFLQNAGATALLLSMGNLSCSPERPPETIEKTSALKIEYGDWRDVYHEQWQWDKVVRGTHTNANCAANCSWDLYVRDGIVWREEQTANYTASNASVPDFNPRGCQKGASCSDLMMGPSRLNYPMQRVGPRGSGKWKRIHWDEALDSIATEFVSVLDERGGDGVVCELGTCLDFGPMLAGTQRFFRFVGGSLTDNYSQVGDMAFGGTVTLGAQLTDGSSDDWFRSDYIVLWGCNPSATRIPDAHFLNEARYNGADVVVISPDYNQSAIHANLWLGVKPSADAALAMSACQVIVSEGLYQEDYIREQTDLPFLVRSDTGRFLRESDIAKGGSEELFAFWDEARGELDWALGSMGSSEKTLELAEGVRPALNANQKVRLLSGEMVVVDTVFSSLQKELQKFEPERASIITGIAPDVIRRFARDFADAPSALIIMGYCIGKNYYGDLAQRGQILMASLTGNIGRAGGGWRSLGMVVLEGLSLVGGAKDLGIPSLIGMGIEAYRDPKGVRDDFLSLYISSTLFHAIHGGLMETQLSEEYADPGLPRSPRSYLEEALEKGHFLTGPPAGSRSPEILVSAGGNILRNCRMGDKVRDSLYANAKLVVDINIRMSATGRHADILLPAAGWYEKIGLKYLISLAPYFTFGDRAIPPRGEAKPEWEIYSLLAKHIADEAKRRGVSTIQGHAGKEYDISKLDEVFSDEGRFGPDAEEDVMRYILQMSQISRKVSLEDLRREGAMRIPTFGSIGASEGIYSEYSPDEPLVPLRDFVEKKQPYPTLTGRQQFYIDHPWYLEIGEALPTHKESPKIGGEFPFSLTGGHARWSIHSISRDQELLLHLQRGEPIIYLNADDARERGIEDHDLAFIWNDVNDFLARVKVMPSLQPYQVHIFHGWEPYQFRNGKSHQFLAPSPLRVSQLVGNYGHLFPEMTYWDPGQFDRGTRVDVRKARDDEHI